MSDLKDKQAVIDALNGYPETSTWSDDELVSLRALLSPAQPEPCEDAVNKIKNASFTGSDGLDYVETLVALDALKLASLSAQPVQAIKDCRNCRHGKFNDHYQTYFCYNSDKCEKWKKWEPSAQLEIVRCKDCGWSDKRGCALYCRAWNRYTAWSGWCHKRRERREE